LKEAQEKNAVRLFGDEVSFAMWGSLGRTWAPRGEQPVVKTTGIRKGLKMFGAIEFNGGNFQYLESLAYELTPKSIKALKADDVPDDILKKLTTLKNDKYKTQASFTKALENILSQEHLTMYQTLILKHTQTSGRFNGESYVEFLKQLLQHFEAKIILIEDGAPYHNSQVVTDFIKKPAAQLTVKRLPAFSPDYNQARKIMEKYETRCHSLEIFQNF
jgi:hypothetical protein